LSRNFIACDCYVRVPTRRGYREHEPHGMDELRKPVGE